MQHTHGPCSCLPLPPLRRVRGKAVGKENSSADTSCSDEIAVGAAIGFPDPCGPDGVDAGLAWQVLPGPVHSGGDGVMGASAGDDASVVENDQDGGKKKDCDGAHGPAVPGSPVAQVLDGRKPSTGDAGANGSHANGDTIVEDAAEEDEVGRQKEEALRQALLKKKGSGQEEKDNGKRQNPEANEKDEKGSGKADRKRDRRCGALPLPLFWRCSAWKCATPSMALLLNANMNAACLHSAKAPAQILCDGCCGGGCG